METTQLCIQVYVNTIDIHTNIHVNQGKSYGIDTKIYIHLCENYCNSYKHTSKTMHIIWKQHKYLYTTI